MPAVTIRLTGELRPGRGDGPPRRWVRVRPAAPLDPDRPSAAGNAWPPPGPAAAQVDRIPRLLDPGPTPLPPESKGNGLRLAGEPSLG